MVPELSPCRTDASPHCICPAFQDVHGTYLVATHRGFVVSGFPHSAGMSSFDANFISPNSCHTLVSS